MKGEKKNMECDTPPIQKQNNEKLLTGVHECEQTLYAPRSPTEKSDISLKCSFPVGSDRIFII